MTDSPSLSHSALSTYRDCQLRYKYERVLQLTPRGGRPSHALRFGSAGHAALAKLYSGATLREVGESVKGAYPADEYPDPLPRYSPGKSQGNFLDALWGYIKGPWQEDQRNWEVLEVETPQMTDGLGEYDHMLILDLIVRDRQDGLVWGVDHKITSKYINDLWNRYELSSQVRMYTAEIKRRYGNCGGFIINGISLRHRSRAYTPRTGPDKGVALPAGDWYAFGRMAYRPDASCLELEAANVRATADDIRRSIATDTWSYNTERCGGGTAWECCCYGICKPGWSWPRDRESIIEYYRRRCGRRVMTTAGMGHCELAPDHDGDCDPTPIDDDDSSLPTIIVAPEEDEYFQAIED